MPRHRLSLAGLLTAVALLVLGGIALRSGTRTWFVTLNTLTAGILLTAVLLTRPRRSRTRSFWFGFAVLGGGYYLLAIGPWIASVRSIDNQVSAVNPDLLSSLWLDSTLPYVRGNARTYQLVDEFAASTTGVGHLMVASLLASLGGILSVMLQRRRMRRVAAVANTPAQGNGSIAAVLIAAGVFLTGLTGMAVSRDSLAPDYFPATVFEKNPGEHAKRKESYTKDLSAMREPSLARPPQREAEPRVVRLLIVSPYYRSAHRNPLCFRVTGTGTGARVRLVVLAKSDFLTEGDEGTIRQVAIDMTVAIDETAKKALDKALRELESELSETEPADNQGYTGVQIVIEQREHGIQRVVQRWEPKPEQCALFQWIEAVTHPDLMSRRTLPGRASRGQFR